MEPKISVERQYRFHCLCGATTETGEKTVTCSGCGAVLGVHRVRRYRQHRRNSVAYYGSARPVPHRTSPAVSDGSTVPVRRVERYSQRPNPTPHMKANALPPEWAGMSSIESDFEQHPGDGRHGAFIVWFLIPLVLLAIFAGLSHC